MPKALHVTHHALLRYLERVRGFKFDKEISEIRTICCGVTNGHIKAHGCIFEIKNGALITVTPDNGGPSRTRRQEVE